MIDDNLQATLATARIGETDGDISLSRSEEHYQTLLTMLGQAGHSLYIYSRYLDGQLYNTGEFLHALRQLAIEHPQSHIRILLRDLEPLVKQGHRLIELGRHLSSSVEFRNVHKDYGEYNEAFAIVDGKALIHRKLADRYEGVANFNSPAYAAQLLRFFNEVWEHSSPPPDARRLYL